MQAIQTAIARPQWAGKIYNLGNLCLMLGALAGVSAGSEASLSAPLSATASIFFLASGVFYSKEQYTRGNGISAAGALLLSVHMALSGLIFSAVLVALMHALPKLMGALPEHARRIGISKPEKLAGFLPMATRLPVSVEAFLTGDVFLLAAALAWLFADWCLAGAVSAKNDTAR